MTATTPPAGLIDWRDVHTGGMPAYERALRAIETGYLKLIAGNAQSLRRERQTFDQLERLAEVLKSLAETGLQQSSLLAERDIEIVNLSARVALLESLLLRRAPVSGEGS